MIHSYKTRIYFEDTDAGGIVYHANYLRYAERARSEMLRAEGFQSSDALKTGQGFVVVHMDITYKKSAVLDDEIDVRSCVTAIGRTKMVLRQDIYRGDTLLTEMQITLVYIDFGKGATKIPDDVLEKLEKYKNE